MKKLHEHPVPILISIIGGLIAISYTLFVFFTGKPGLAQENNESKTEKIPEQKQLPSVDTTTNGLKTPPAESKNSTTIPVTSSTDTVLNKKAVSDSPAPGYNFTGTYRDDKTDSYITFYNRKGNKYEFSGQVNYKDNVGKMQQAEVGGYAIFNDNEIIFKSGIIDNLSELVKTLNNGNRILGKVIIDYWSVTLDLHRNKTEKFSIQ